MSSQHRFHRVRERWNHVPRDQEGRHVEQVQEDLVPVAQGRPEVAVASGATCAQLLRPEHPMDHDDMISC